MDGSFTIPDGYASAFANAEYTFLYQRVYCPLRKTLVVCQEQNILAKVEIEQLDMIGAYVYTFSWNLNLVSNMQKP